LSAVCSDGLNALAMTATEANAHRSAADRLREAGLLSGAAMLVEFASSTDRGHRVDIAVFRKVNHGLGGTADAFFGGLTELGSITASAAGAAVLALGGRRRAALMGAGAAGSMWLLGQALKKLYLRVRPYDRIPDLVRLLIGRPPGTSWPSSHPAVLLAFLTVAGEELGLSRSERAGLTALNGLVAMSRTYLGVHYPSDVIAGMLFGRAVAQVWLAAGGTKASPDDLTDAVGRGRPPRAGRPVDSAPR